jgi:hypothetical protein
MPVKMPKRMVTKALRRSRHLMTKQMQQLQQRMEKQPKLVRQVRKPRRAARPHASSQSTMHPRRSSLTRRSRKSSSCPATNPSRVGQTKQQQLQLGQGREEAITRGQVQVTKLLSMECPGSVRVHQQQLSPRSHQASKAQPPGKARPLQ